ncbi:PLP-dependent aminotransferase family protein [uncultured Tateyamaria sp.]|uniref:aminotransferase-like domain-containing protein n=1 Tax=uncultured Tateyamaria sp. TaxID=455651 RepID=UPI002603A749|nr:PLP-dependent aminotransferase family protein [uncultured Tateyamaria sp.]
MQKFAPSHVGKATALRLAIRRGVTEAILQAQDELPSTRRAAAALQMARNSVIEAYEGLQAEGVIETRRGARPRVCDLPDLQPKRGQRQTAIALSKRGKILSDDHRKGYITGNVDAFAPGLPDPSLFSLDNWAVCLRRAARHSRGPRDLYDEFQGLSILRKALALHLKRARGVSVSPEQVFILPCTQSALALMSELVTDPGDRVMMEDPCYAGGKALFHAQGLETTPLCDDLTTAASPNLAKLIYVTPSTQYPMGTRMKLARRLDILAFAEANNALIFEDDYDGDFVWRGADVPPLFSLDKASTVALLGTASKSLIPAMRLGWLIVPPNLVDPVRRAHRTLGFGVNAHVQAAMAEFITSGHFARHVRTAARVYQERMICLTDALHDSLGDEMYVSRPDGGLQVTVKFDDHVDDLAVKDELWARGIHVLALSTLCIQSHARGLVMGFSRANPKTSQHLARAIRDALGKLS